MDAVSPEDDDEGVERDAPEGPDPLLGTHLAGKYELLEVLGEGAMGRIYRARQADLDRMIAIKVLHKHLGGEDRVARRFHREARAASRLSHPNSVQILDFGSSDGVLYIAMELLEGEDLQTVLDHDPPPSPQRIATILIPVLRAVDEAHRAGIVHRDLKPENVILWADRSGREHVKVCDFGIAKILDGEGNSITVDGFVCGTPQYMAPEQARGDVIDHRVDVYAAGVVLYQMLAGKVPFSGETALGIITKHLTDDPVPPSERARGRHVPRSLEDIALRAMSKSPQDRYQTAGDMADAIAKAVAELGDDGALSLTDRKLEKYAPPPRPPGEAREATGSRRLSRGGREVIDAEAATSELRRASTPPGQSRFVTLGLVGLTAIVLGLAAYLSSAPPVVSDPPSAPPHDPVAPITSARPEETLVEPVDEIPPVEPSGAEAAPDGSEGHASAGGTGTGATAREPGGRGPDGPALGVTEVRPPVPPTPSEPVAVEVVEALSPGASAFAEGRRLFLANEVPAAIARFEDAARLMPSNAEVQRQLGRAHMRAGNVERSLAAYRRYLELAPDAPDRTVVEHIIAGE